MADEKRLIDTSQYKSFLKRYIKELYEVDAPMIAGAVERCLYKLEAQPTVDAVEVVRCKDCTYFRVEPDDFLGICKCGAIATKYGGEIYPEREHFCSYGERREGE